MTQEWSFRIFELATNSPITAGDELEVSFAVINSGDIGGTQTIEVAIVGVASTSLSVELEAGETSHESVTIETPPDAVGETTVTVSSDDDTDRKSVRLTEPTPADVRIFDLATNSPIEAGEELEVTFDVINAGDLAVTQTIEVSVGDIDTKSLSTDVAGGETIPETVTIETPEDAVGETTVRVSSDDDTETTSVTLNEPTDVGDSPGDDGGGADGGIGTTEIAAVGGGGGVLALLGGYVLLRRRGADDDSDQTDGTAGAPSGRESESPGTQGAAGPPSGSADSGVSAGAGDSGTDRGAVSAAAGAAGSDDSDVDIDARLEDIESLLAEARQHRDAKEYDQALAATGRAVEEAQSLRDVVTAEAPHRVSEIDPVLADARDLDGGIETEREDYREARERYRELSNSYDELAAAADPGDPFHDLRELGGLTTRLDRVEEIADEHDFEALSQRVETLRQKCDDLVEHLEVGHTTIQDARSNVHDLEAGIDEAESLFEADEYVASIERLDEVEREMAETSGTVEDFETPDLDERLAALRTRWEDLRERATEARGPTTGEPEAIPTAPRLRLDYADIQRIGAIGTGGNADVYRARVPTPDSKSIDVAVKEPRMGGLLQEETVDLPDGADPTLNPDAFEQPERSAADADESGEHVPGSSGTRAWSRDENIDPDAMGTDYEPGAPATGPDGSSTQAQPGGDGDATDADTKQRGEESDQLLREAEKWEKIDDHDHIVNIVDYGAEPIPWIAMEYMDGGHIAHRAGEVSMDQALWIAIATTKAVRHAHRRGIAHLDLKPDNILFRTVDEAWDVPKVADWGLSKLLLNHSQSVAGLSTHYAAPEQFDREFGQADDITDIYQLGTVFYELFTGQRPFEGRPAQVMRKVLTADVTPPSEIAEIPSEIDDILLKALAREKADRYETVVNLRNDLQAVRESL